MSINARLIRHGEVDERYCGRYLGSTDAGLSSIGRRQAQKLNQACKNLRSPTIWCSPLLRARQTARIIFPHRPAEIIPQLREVDFGEWEGLTFAEIAQKDPSLVDKWACFDQDFAFPGGESLGDFLGRIRHVANRLRKETRDLVMVTHGGVIRSLLCQLHGLPPEKYITFNIQRGELIKVRVQTE